MTPTTTTAPERVYRVREVAQHLGVTPDSVYALIASGALRKINVGRLIRVPESALSDLIAGRPTDAGR